MAGSQRVLRSWKWNTLSAGFCAVLAAVCLATAARDTTPVEVKALLGMLGLVGLLGAGRAMMLGVRAGPDALVIREILFTKRLPWSAVRGARLVRRATTVPDRPFIPMPQLHYVDVQGRPRTVHVNALGTWSRAAARRNVDLLNDLIHTHRPPGAPDGDPAAPTGGMLQTVLDAALFTTEDLDEPERR